MRIAVIIPAAGSSTRFGLSDKLAQDLGGRSLLLRAIEPFTNIDEVSAVIVAGPPDDFESFKDQYGPKLGFLGAKLVEGGREERWESVKKALAFVGDDVTHIAVHDAARPLVRPELLGRLIDAARNARAVAPGIPVADTLKRVSSEVVESATRDATVDSILGIGEDEDADALGLANPGRVVETTIDRSNLMRVQTPQIFEASLLRRAYDQADLSGATDDAMLVEQLGEEVLLITGDPHNIKVTEPADLEMVRLLLSVSAPSTRAAHKRF